MKTKKLQNFIDDFTKKAFGRTSGDGVCVICGSEKIKSEDFRNELSKKEFTISAMCQKCQDDIFGID